jgi:glycosyltransferase involved in cell wall biosynthesis
MPDKPKVLLLAPEPSAGGPHPLALALGDRFDPVFVASSTADARTLRRAVRRVEPEAMLVEIDAGPRFDRDAALLHRASRFGRPVIAVVRGQAILSSMESARPSQRRRAARALGCCSALCVLGGDAATCRRLRYLGVETDLVAAEGTEVVADVVAAAGGHPVRRDRPKVVLVGPVPPPVGGVESVTRALLESELRRDYRIIHCDISRRQSKEHVTRVTLLNLYWGAVFTLRYMWLLVRHLPHLVHIPIVSKPVPFARDSLFALFARALGRRVVLHSHDGYLPEVYQQSSRRRKGWMRSVFNRAARLVAISETWQRFFEQMGVTAPIDVVRNPLDPGFREALEAQAGAPKTPWTALFVGAICRDKGVHDLLEALQHVLQKSPRLRSRIVGPGRYPGEWQSMLELRDRMGLAEAVEMPGSLEGEALMRAYAGASCFVLPTYKEGLPVVLLEAMAAGLPIITTGVGGIPDLIEDGVNGYLIEPGEPAALADRILELAAHPEVAQRMGEANVAKVKGAYELSAVAARMAEVYRMALAR